MPALFKAFANWAKRIHTALDSLLYGISIYALPAVIALVTLVALVAWEAKYPAAEAVALDLKTVEQTAEPMTPAAALARVEREPAVRFRDTRLSENPFWLLMSIAPPDARSSAIDDPVVIELPSRHATGVACWNSATLQPIGNATRTAGEGRVRSIKAGFAIDMGRMRAPASVLCKASFVGPARISAARWASSLFEGSALEFHRNSGLLDGGLIVLAIFVLMTAAINRESVYVIFAAWLVFNLRMGAISAGWDTQWLGRMLPAEWLAHSRLITVAGYYTLTIMLFRRMFRDDLERVGYQPLLRAAQWSCLPLFPLALFVTYGKALPIMWVASAASILTVAFFLIRILATTRSTVAMWYGASLAITLGATLYEVIAAALGIKDLIGAVNSVTAALSSSLMAAFAIAEQIRLERHQRVKAETELRLAYEAIPIGLFTLDARGGFVSTNPALRSMLGISAGVPPAGWASYFGGEAWLRLQTMLMPAGAAETEVTGSESSFATDRKRFLVKAALSGDRIEGSLQDITEKSKALDRLHFLAENDPLTGVLNRRGVEHRLENALAALADGSPLAVAYLDLDRFKLVNDLYGHAVGDEVLQQVCARVTEMLTPGQEVGRIGGDEFVILFQGTPIRAAAWTCRGILERLEAQPYLVGEKAFQIGGSIGLVEADPGAQVKDVIAAADQGCREAKRGQGGSLVVYERSASVFRAREEDLRLIERLSGAGGPHGLFLEMQPLLSARDPFGTLDFEVLLRMRDAGGALIEAGRIIPLAEDKGCIGIIDRWVLATTLAWLNQHGDRLAQTRFVCMNLSGASLNDEHFVQDALALLSRYPQSARRLCIEITESVALHDLANMRRFIDTVRRAGAKVALDDFGAGYTSFSYLKDLPADVLKIDGAFSRGVNTHPANLAIVEAIVSLARSLGMRTIAEWAEDRATVQTLIEVGIDFIQGYAVARPQSPEQILGAHSAGGFVQDERLRQYLHSLTAPVADVQLWEDRSPAKPTDLH